MRIQYVVLSLLIASSAAQAKGDGSARQTRERAAKKACITGDVARGIDILGDLFVETGDINYVFNQARCYQQNHRWEEALDRFTEYRRKAKEMSVEDQNEVDAYIADCKAHIDKEGVAASAATPNPVASSPPAIVSSIPSAASVPSEPPVREVSALASAESTAHPGAGLRTAGIVVASVGAAALVAGTLFNLQYNKIVDELPKHYDSGDEARSHTYKTMAIVGYSAGAACLAGGTLLYVLGASRGRVSVAPSVAAGYAGASMETRF